MVETMKRRNLLAQLFVVMLIGIAYQEMIGVVRDSLWSDGQSLQLAMLFIIFFLTSLRFFIGAQLHLVDESLIKMRSGVWFFDFMFIVLEMVVFIFLGSVTSLSVSRNVRIDFIELLMMIYIIDVMWVVFQYVFGRLMRSWRREFVPTKWALINLGALILVGAIYFSGIDGFSYRGLLLITLVNVIAFVIDVFVIDYFEVA